MKKGFAEKKETKHFFIFKQRSPFVKTQKTFQVSMTSACMISDSGSAESQFGDEKDLKKPSVPQLRAK